MLLQPATQTAMMDAGWATTSGRYGVFTGYPAEAIPLGR
jgi:hypothetical protein